MEESTGTVKTGIVEDIEFRLYSFGEQITTINGKRYMTWWDFKDGIEVGVRVQFTEYLNAKFWDSPKMSGDLARKLKVLDDPEPHEGKSL